MFFLAVFIELSINLGVIEKLVANAIWISEALSLVFNIRMHAPTNKLVNVSRCTMKSNGSVCNHGLTLTVCFRIAHICNALFDVAWCVFVVREIVVLHKGVNHRHVQQIHERTQQKQHPQQLMVARNTSPKNFKRIPVFCLYLFNFLFLFINFQL